jgi:hypothetical protein
MNIDASPSYSEFRQQCNLYDIDICHNGDWLDVYTHRLVFRVFHNTTGDDEPPVYKMVGSVHSLLCRIESTRCSKYDMKVMKDVVLSHRLQWCVALLGKHSSVEDGKVELLHWDGQKRLVEDSLEAEMQRMCIIKDGGVGNLGFNPVSAFPTVDGHSDKCECSIGWFVDNWTIVADRHHTAFGDVDIPLGSYKVPGQGLNLPVYFTYGSPAFLRMLLEISILWKRSFIVHSSYVRRVSSCNDADVWRRL